MHSPEFEDLCLLYASGELAQADQARFREHRSQCAQCAAFLEAMAFGSRVARAAASSLPERALERVRARVLTGDTSAGHNFSPSRWLWLRIALPALATITFGVCIYPGLPAPSPNVMAEDKIESSLDLVQSQWTGLEAESTLTEGEGRFEADMSSLERSTGDDFYES